MSYLTKQPIRVRNARQNNLQGVDVEVPVGGVTLVTGVAGAGKSSLVFDVLYAEGHRRYVETFSTYARQFLERLDRPDAEAVEGVLPGIAIGRTAPVKTSRSTVGTITSIDDYLRPLFARAAGLYCQECGQRVQCDTPASVYRLLIEEYPQQTAFICFTRPVGDVSPESLRETFRQAGFSRLLENGVPVRLEEADFAKIRNAHAVVVLDRVIPGEGKRRRLMESLETAFKYGHGHIDVYVADIPSPLRFSDRLHCPDCDVEYSDPVPALFSFNNPVGACERCNGFGRIIDIDPDLVIPDQRRSLAEGCVKPFQTDSFAQCQEDLLAFAYKHGIPADVPWQELAAEDKEMIWYGEPGGRWYGVKAFFDWLQSRRYRKHARILMSRYRHYLPCPVCRNGKLKENALNFYLGDKNFPQVQALSIGDALAFFENWQPPAHDAAVALLVNEIRQRLSFLNDVGLTYLSLSRKSRTLSGGETQRVTLATALGSSLTNTLYVLDEPSVGLHARDKERLAGVLSRLARLGNAVVVVEHDPAFLAVADHVIDLGPGPGLNGGKVVYQGPLSNLAGCRESVTAACLREIPGVNPSARQEKQVRQQVRTESLKVSNARENNLADLTVEFPLNTLTCVCGVSGSGKSSLVDYVLYRNIQRSFGLQVMEPGECGEIEGIGQITRTEFVDQSPLSRSSRMNAATYMKILDPLRAVFAATEAARERGFTSSAFSFNTAAGACPHCQGSGFERVELQFLPDAFVRCPACDGQRFRSEVLEVRCREHNIAEVLALPADETAELFSDNSRIVKAVQPLLDIGLGYLSLSQAAPTLSGGEAQRLKIARHLAQAQESTGILFLLDEPTTGLHPADVRELINALYKLVDNGNSVIVIEHDLAVIQSAEWVVELGPEGGDRGGRIVGEGSPDTIVKSGTPTGEALRKIRQTPVEEFPARTVPAENSLAAAETNYDERIRVTGAREHNLANIDVSFPRDQLIAVTGVSGSGKSTLAFDVLYAEGRQRFLDCLPAYARQYTQPLTRADVDKIESVPPTVALQQKVTPAAAMSTTGTVSEIYHYLRLLFASLGVPHCPKCDIAGEKAEPAAIARRVAEQFPGCEIQILAPLIKQRKGYHKDIIEHVRKHGIDEVRVDGEFYSTASPPALDRYRVHDVEALINRRRVTAGAGKEQCVKDIENALQTGGGSMKISVPEVAEERLFSTRRSCPECGAGLPTSDPRLFIWSQKFGACPACNGSGIDPRFSHDDDEEELAEPPVCPDCFGTRLRPEARAVRINDKHIGEIAALSFTRVRDWLQSLNMPESEVAERVFPELQTRLNLLEQLGVGYLTVDRATNTLATGEAQRVRIAAELSSNLRGVCYVLDEPTVGLHQRDIRALIRCLEELRENGNTVVVVEHEESFIRTADTVIDMGPGAGTAGGKVVAEGAPDAIRDCPESVTGCWLRGDGKPPAWQRRGLNKTKKLKLKGAKLHNLQNIDVDFPLERLVCVTGVSGSGKSTLVRDVTYRAVQEKLRGHAPSSRLLTSITGWEHISSAKEVDESPIGRTPRSVPATYIGVMDVIRQIFARTADARTLGYKAGRFSFNVKGGRCEACGGQGRHKVEMPLLPVVYIPCDECDGRRYNAETLNVKYNDKSVADVLEMTVDESLSFFRNFPRVVRPLKFLAEIGLGYVRLGQPSPTLSGGEAQRLKLAAELAGRSRGGGFYVLDEPTTGLHMADVAKLLRALQKLVENGNTVIVIEHDLDMISSADCVIDLGPEGGEEGGSVVARGTPEEIARSQTSRTAPFLREYLQ